MEHIDHLLGCVAVGSNCPCPTAHRRLREVHTFWHRCQDNYQDPEAFRIDLNAAIQALRNVTFAIQKEMAHLEGFAEWYAGWRDSMKRTPVLVWLVEARNRIVKEGDLEGASETRARVILNYFDVANGVERRAAEEEMQSFAVPTRALSTVEEIREAATASDIPTYVLQNAVVEIERRWVPADFPGIEVLTALGFAFAFLASLVADADSRFSAAEPDPDLDARTIGTAQSPYPQRLRPVCMEGSAAGWVDTSFEGQVPPGRMSPCRRSTHRSSRRTWQLSRAVVT